jgi:replicative DNA helicase
MKSQGPQPSIPLYFSPTLQDITGGLHPGEMWVVGGFSSTGKSAFAVNMVIDILRARDKRVVIFNTEMTQETYMTRLMSNISGVPTRIIRDRVTIGHEQQESLSKAARYLRESPWKVYDTIGNIQAIRTEAMRLKNDEGLDVIILDYIQSMDGGTGEEVRDARTIANVCQSMAKELDCVVVAFSQLSNSYAQDDNTQGGTSNFYSFKGSGAIRDNADLALMLRRDRKNSSPMLSVRIEKNRSGEVGSFDCMMDLPTGRIREMETGELQDGRR